MIVKLPYGNGTCAIDLRGLRVLPIEPTAPPGSRDLGRQIAAALDAPLEGPSLQALAMGRRSATIVVPDATRKAELPTVLPLILERLARGGIPAAATSVLVACGTHPPAPQDTLARLLGPLPTDMRVLQHDSRDRSTLVSVGELRPGLPLRLHRLAVEAELLVTVGPVLHHYIAGFGGGPKMIFPGVAGYAEIQANHALVIDLGGDVPRRHPGCEPGALEGNPVAEEIARAADLHPPDLCLCLVRGSGGVAWAGASPWRAALAAAVERSRAWYEVAPSRHQLVVACGGGAPADATLIQAHKGFDAASRFLEPGGELLYVAEIADGPGSADMEPFLADPRPEAILERLAGRYVQYGHTTLRIVEKTSRLTVHLHSRLDPDLSRRLGFLPAARPDDVVESWRGRLPGATVGVLVRGAVYPRRGGESSCLPQRSA